ncbi:aminoglycoside phosphotransferase family protein [Paenibacillus sp. PL2-23]|uniref:phosphotransferase family protein n=1 Tax=Paenibacillus sp. PL2-23 TaxID=2100729 RepID=UPI0030FBF6F7
MKKISEGRTAEIFAHDQQQIIKLYRDGFPIEVVKYEYEVNQLVARLGVPAPRAFALVDSDERNGIVFDRIEGTTLLRMSIEQPGELNRLSQKFAALHYRIHNNELDVERIGEAGASIYKQKKVLAQNILNASSLTTDVKKRIVEYLENLPDGNHLCHGDFHPDNVMIGERSWIIDWMTGVIGNPAGDVARTILLFRFGTLPDGAPSHVIEALELMRDKMHKLYLDQYLDLSGLPFSDIDEWMLPVAAARLTEWIPAEEQNRLLQFIEERLK